LQAAFADTIADYRDWCQERGKEPEKPYSGNFTVRHPLICAVAQKARA